MTTLTDADLDRIEADIGPFYGEVDALVAEVRRLRAHTTTTLVACSRCDRGIPPRYAVTAGDGRLCPECAGDEVRRLREALLPDRCPCCAAPAGDGWEAGCINWKEHLAALRPGDDATEGE